MKKEKDMEERINKLEERSGHLFGMTDKEAKVFIKGACILGTILCIFGIILCIIFISLGVR